VTVAPEPPRHLYIFGAGGQGREAAWFARAAWGSELPLTFVVDEARYLPSDSGVNAVVLDDLQPRDGDRWVTAVGSVPARRRAQAALSATGMPPAQVVHPSVDLSAVSRLGDDVIVSAGAVLSVGVVVEDHVHVNVASTVSHDTLLREYATLSPGVHIAGWVDVGEEVLLGTGACVINGSPERRLVLGARSVVAAGACVVTDVVADAMYAGVPAQRKR
jgi:sugar O-acyltransferase (sialic acid O-acetyltransferase NeuD family)